MTSSVSLSSGFALLAFVSFNSCCIRRARFRLLFLCFTSISMAYSIKALALRRTILAMSRGGFRFAMAEF